MPLSRADVEALFQVGNTFASSTFRTNYTITAIEDDCVRIEPAVAKTPLRLAMRELSVIFDGFDALRTDHISDAVRSLLQAHGLDQTQTEPHLFAFVREYRDRIAVIAQARRMSVATAPLPEEIDEAGPLLEGAVARVTINAYERNPDARAACIAHYGTRCVVCGFDFGEVYGPDADGYIHVHHLKPLSEIGREYQVHPIADLRPVCPNCHAVIHFGGRNRSIDEVRALLNGGRSG